MTVAPRRYEQPAHRGNAREGADDGLLYHETDLEIAEHYSDTVAFSDQIFGICQLLGFRYAPRIRDLADKRLHPFEKASAYPNRSR